MKNLIITSILTVLLTGGSAMRAQDMPDEYLGLPGDNLNLYAVMKLFQESETLEGFERELNNENSRINNLDLNGDNMVDYITVSDYADGNVHTIVLRAAMSRNESQDVAIFTVEQLRNGEVRIQLIGDEALYGRNYIIEPNYAETPNPGYRGNNSNATVVTTTYYNIGTWPVIRFIYHPAYVVWRSSWYWGYYPGYWNPWQPYYWHYYYGYHHHWYPHYYRYYHHSNHHYYAHYHDHYYKSIRTHSPHVSNRIKEGRYSATYSRPEQRREGEALYARAYSGRNTGSQARISAGASERRTTLQPTQNMRTATGSTGTARRTTESTATSRTSTSTSAGRQTTNTQRAIPSTTTNRSSETRPAEQRATTTTGKSTPAAVNRPAVRPTTTQRTTTSAGKSTPAASPATTQRTTTSRSSSSASVSQRPSSKPASTVQRTAPERRSGSSAPSSKTVSRSSNTKSSSQAGRSATPASGNSESGGSSTNSSGRR